MDEPFAMHALHANGDAAAYEDWLADEQDLVKRIRAKQDQLRSAWEQVLKMALDQAE